MIWRLTYCNKDGVEARLDIIRGGATPVETIEGTATPFILNYKLDKSDKSGFFMTSSADISIFETPTFNIDNLKTSSETEIKVEHYINNVLDWSGFVIPDFFSKTIGTPATVEMVASDRLGTLKGVTPEDLSQYESMRDLAVKCLAKTGLSLPLYTMADFGNNGTTNAFFKALGLSGRLSDTKGRNISCYDILKSILVASNSKLVQQGGAWHIVNKWQHEQGAGNLFSTLTASTAYSEQTVSFSDVHVGARRTIIPVGATTGVFHEFGGGRSYPENFDFRDGTTGWTANGGFIPLIKTTPITSYLIRTNDAQFNSTISVNSYLFNSNTFSTDKYLQSKSIIPYDTGKIEVSIEINATGPMMGREELASEIRVSIGIEISTGLYRWLNDSGAFISDTATVLNGKFPTRSPGFDNYRASTGTFGFKGTYDNPMGKNLVIRIYGSYEGASKREIGYNFVSATFKQSIEEPKGTIYKRTQGVGFTKEHDLDTTIFGDYLTIGLDGAFYQSRVDDTSYLYSTAGTLTEPLWTAHGDTEQLPLLQHVTRQKSRMFSLAHNMISARIDVTTFKPLNIFVDCNVVNPRHVVVSASYDFLRSEVEVELEQIAYATLDVREYIYSYFGEGESGISSVGGISGGGTGTGGGGSGGGMTADQVAILSEVQVLAHDHGNKEVLDQVTQDVVDNALREMIISTDTETELTDENYLSSLRVLKEILDNNEYLRTQFLSKVNPDTANKIITFLEGLEVGTFSSGALGSGAAVKMIDGTSYAEVDNLTVRQKATFRELIIEALKHIGGQLVLSPARMKCNKVVDGGTYYKCYFDTGDGEVSNEFVTGDQARCQVFTGSGTKFYWRLVTSVGEDWINLSKTDAVVGSDAPASGDDISQLGNRTDITRQSAIILSTVGADAPSWKQYSGINSFDLASKETTVFTRLGNRIQGKTVFTSGGTNLEDVLDGVGSDIQDAQATADGKSTTHLFQPTKYKLGDMWVLNTDQTVNGTAYKAGEILTATQDSATFVQAHWVKRVRYTDDTAVENLQIGGRNLFSVNDFVADNKARGYSTIDVINYNGNIAYRSSSITNNHLIPRYLQGKFEANTQYYLQFKINWESYTNSGAQYVFRVVYTDGTLSNFYATTSQTSRSMLTPAGKTINYITTTRQYDGTVVIYEVQIEKGNKATDWKPAIEDTEREVLEAQGYMRARYIRDWAGRNTANNYSLWYEVKVFNKAGVNVAQGKSVEGKRPAGSSPYSNITDGNTTTYGQPTGVVPEGETDWVKIDLGQIYYDIDYIHIWHHSSDSRTYFGTKTEISEDGVNWTPIFDSATEGTYKETAEGKIHTQRYASVVNRIAETEAKTRFQTLIDGGLIYTALMKLFDTTGGDETAFISGKQGAGKNLPAFGAGGSYQDAIAGTAKAIIRHDGSSKFTDTEVTGTVNAASGSIGGLNIYDNAIASYPDLGGLVPPGEHIHISKTGVSIDRNVGLSQNQVITSVRITDDGIRVSKSDSDGYKSMEVRIDGIYRNGVKIL